MAAAEHWLDAPEDGVLRALKRSATGGWQRNDANGSSWAPTDWHIIGTGDFNGDDRDDIFIACFGPDVLLRNRGDGTFEDITAKSGGGLDGGDAWGGGVAMVDVNGDGRLDIASVTTPHIGGVLTLHHYRPPRLEPYACFADVSNHRMGALEQELAVIVHEAGQRPAIVVVRG